jgi:ribosomal protein S5
MYYSWFFVFTCTVLCLLYRDALRNLHHIDLYDNFGLAHDVYGKHNACHAYVRATPVGRQIVGGQFAISILNLFGIASASVKFEGRRQPYAMVRALFNAVDTHVNIDDQAKARGKRYLTLRWAKDKGLM